MAKSQKRSNREAKKPKKTAAEKSKSAGLAIAGQIAGVPMAGSGSTYKDRYK
jgi:hypothetical protein